MADDKFRLPGSSYDQLTRIIKAYGTLTEASPPRAVAQVLGVDPTIVSRNNGFLLAIGLVEGGNNKQLTEVGRALSHALDHNIEGEVQGRWSDVVRHTEFLSRLVTAVRIRDGMEQSTLQSHVAYTAGQPNKGAVKTGAATVIEILKAAGWLADRDGKLVAVQREESAPGDQPAAIERTPEPQSAPLAEPDRVPRPAEAAVSTAESQRLTPVISVQVRVSVDCKVEELPELAASLKELLRTTASSVEVEVESHDDA